MNKEELMESNEQLKAELEKVMSQLTGAETMARSETARAGDLQQRLENVQINRNELIAAFDELKREYDAERRNSAALAQTKVVEHSHPVEKFRAIVETEVLALITGPEIQRLFHNPTTPAMKQAAAMLTEKIIESL